MSEQDTGLPQRRGRVGWIVATALLGVVVLAALVMLRDRPPIAQAVPLPNDAQAYAESRGEPTASAATATAPPAGSDIDAAADDATPAVGSAGSQRKPPLTASTEPAASAIATLLPLAKSGRADAMNELAHRLIACRNYVDVTETSIRRNVLQRFYRRRGQEPSTDNELTQIAADIERDTAMVERCRDIDPALMDSRIDWLERAARAGDIGAMLDYPGYALNDMRSYDDILRNFDEVGRRRQLAGELLRGALDRGACEALPMFALAYSGGRNRYDWLFKADTYLGLVYTEAASRSGQGDPGLARARERLVDPVRQAAAATQAAALASRHCGIPG